jgi:hypothetical protein
LRNLLAKPVGQRAIHLASVAVYRHRLSIPVGWPLLKAAAENGQLLLRPGISASLANSLGLSHY